MRPGGAGLLLAVLALAGCKGTDPKPAPKREPVGSPASRPKGKNSDWLDAMNKLPGAGTEVPKAGSWADPRDPGFDAAREGRGLLAGRVLDPNGQGAKNVFIRIDPVGEAGRGGAPLGILTDAAGYFAAKDLVPGKAYTLTAEAKTADGRALSGVVQTRPPQPNVAIALRDDLPPAPARPGPSNPGTGLPPPADLRPGGGPPVPDLPPAAPGSDTPLPPPAGLTGDNIPPMDLAPKPPTPPPADGAFAPGVGAKTGGLPATVGGPAPATPTQPVTPADPPTTTRPENTAAGPAPPWKPPAANIPGPPVPALPSLPPSTPPAPAGDGKKSQRPVKPGANFALVDALDRPWDLATSRQGSVVLVEFLTTTCGPCKAAVPGLVDVQSRYAADGLELVGVVCDEAPARDRLDRAEKYRQAHQLNYALYVEPGPQPGAVRDRLGVSAYPTAVLLDAEGNVTWKGHPGDRPALEAAVRRALGK